MEKERESVEESVLDKKDDEDDEEEEAISAGINETFIPEFCSS